MMDGSISKVVLSSVLRNLKVMMKVNNPDPTIAPPRKANNNFDGTPVLTMVCMF